MSTLKETVEGPTPAVLECQRASKRPGELVKIQTLTQWLWTEPDSAFLTGCQVMPIQGVKTQNTHPVLEENEAQRRKSLSPLGLL